MCFPHLPNDWKLLESICAKKFVNFGILDISAILAECFFCFSAPLLYVLPDMLINGPAVCVKNPYLEFVWVLVCLCIFSLCMITLKDNTFQNYNAQEKLNKIKHINMNSP